MLPRSLVRKSPTPAVSARSCSHQMWLFLVWSASEIRVRGEKKYKWLAGGTMSLTMIYSELQIIGFNYAPSVLLPVRINLITLVVVSLQSALPSLEGDHWCLMQTKTAIKAVNWRSAQEMQPVLMAVYLVSWSMHGPTFHINWSQQSLNWVSQGPLYTSRGEKMLKQEMPTHL